jgi:flagellar basal body-associated protein FliL
MPNLGAPELLIMLFIFIVIIVIIVIVVVAIVAGVRRTGRGQARAPVATPPGWLTDPMQRHEYRYWDGTQWTAAVSDDGAASSDPL